MAKTRKAEVSYVEFTADKCIVKNKDGDASCVLTKEEAERIGLKRASEKSQKP